MCYTYQPLEISIIQGIKILAHTPDADTADTGHIKTYRHTHLLLNIPIYILHYIYCACCLTA